MVNLVKLAVGIRDVAHLRAVQALRMERDPPLRHQTRNRPKRAAELADGGSIYWVIAGAVVARQRVVDVTADRWDDGTVCAGLVLDPVLVAVEARPMKPFQGWRYLETPPADVTAASVGAELPETLRTELRALGLL
jgi:hypothetical protein